MTHGEFVWIDLSTFDVDAAADFYGRIFHWTYASDGSGYTYCSRAGETHAALFEMPSMFQKIGMPSFWMTYIAVQDLGSTAALAEKLGGKIELTEASSRGEIALIRDPLGAGFTCYEGNELSARSKSGEHGTWTWSELYVSELERVHDFYQQVFQWNIEPESARSNRHAITNGSGDHLASLQVAGSELRGDKEFWAVYFTVDDLTEAAKEIVGAGGRAYPISENHMAATDPQGATFFLTEKS